MKDRVTIARTVVIISISHNSNPFPSNPYAPVKDRVYRVGNALTD